MSKIEVDQVDPQSGTTLTLGTSGDTVTIPSGVSITNNGTATGFGGNGAANWQSAIKTAATFTAVAGEGYFVDTSSNAITANLPAGSVGAIVAFKDYANNFGTNALTLSANGSEKIGGAAVDATVEVNGQAVSLVYADATKGWLVTDDGLQGSASQTYDTDILVVAGGGGGGDASQSPTYATGGGGGGGHRTSTQAITIGNVYTVTVGDGGGTGANGSDSTISGNALTTITSTGGGKGGASGTLAPGGGNGGSGGGGGGNATTINGGSGNTPSTTPSQGNNGGDGNGGNFTAGGGGGGAGAVGATATQDNGGNGGNGTASSITGSSVTRAGGGGGGSGYAGANGTSAGTGGSGGGGAGSISTFGANGTANTGGGGGGGRGAQNPGASGGKGVVILSVPDANYSGTTTGSPTVATGVSGKTIITFNSSGSYTA